MSMTATSDLNWDDLRPDDFEQLLYDLLSELGFINVDWRKGTPKKAASPDSGRDLEADMQREDADGHNWIEHWFIQAKHHSSAVSPADFRDALAWAEARRPEVLLLAVSALSNPSKQYIEDYERTNKPSFRIRVWERPRIERLLSRYPDLLRRYFRELNPARVMLNNALEDWGNHGVLLDSDRLQIIFDQAKELGLDENGEHGVKYLLLLAEYANGDPSARTWLKVFPFEDLAGMLPLAIINLIYHFGYGLHEGRKWAWVGLGGQELKGALGILPALAGGLLAQGIRPTGVAQLLWAPHKFAQSSEPKTDEMNVRRLFRPLLMRVVVRPLLTRAVSQCSQTCGGATIEDLEAGGYRIGTSQQVACKLNVKINWGIEDSLERDRSLPQLCPAWLLAMTARGMPANDEAKMTRRELSYKLKHLGLLLERGARLLSDPDVQFEPALVP